MMEFARTPSPARGRRWPDEVGSDEGRCSSGHADRRGGESPHPTPLRGATPDQVRGRLLSRKREKGRALCAVLAVLFLATPAHAASVTTLDFVAATQPANAFLVDSDRLAASNASPRLAAFAQREAVGREAIAQNYATWAVAERQRAVAADLGPSLDMLGGLFGPADRIVVPVIRKDRTPVLQQLAALSGESFDTLYRASQLDALDALVSFDVDYIKNGDDDTLRRLAVEDLPRVRRLRAEVEQLR